MTDMGIVAFAIAAIVLVPAALFMVTECGKKPKCGNCGAKLIDLHDMRADYVRCPCGLRCSI